MRVIKKKKKKKKKIKLCKSKYNKKKKSDDNLKKNTLIITKLNLEKKFNFLIIKQWKIHFSTRKIFYWSPCVQK